MIGNQPPLFCVCFYSGSNPWQAARKGYGDSTPASEVMPKEQIQKYYMMVNLKDKIGTENGC